MAGVCERECMGHISGDEPLTLTRCHSSGLPWLYEAFEWWEFVCGRDFNIRAKRGNFLFFFSFLGFASLLL